MEFHPSVVYLSETHLYNDAPNSFCPPGYVVAARRDRSKHGGGVLILTREHILGIGDTSTKYRYQYFMYSILRHRVLFVKNRNFDS